MFFLFSGAYFISHNSKNVIHFIEVSIITEVFSIGVVLSCICFSECRKLYYLQYSEC